MKYMVLFLSLLFTTHTMAGLVEEVYQYNQGSCWIKEDREEGILNVIDFSSKRARSISYADLFNELAFASVEAFPAGLMPINYKSFIHCNATGVKFILNTVISDDKKSQKHRLCLRFDILDREAKLNEMGILTDSDTGPCEGSDPYKLLAGTSNQADFEQYVRPVLNELVESKVLAGHEHSNGLLKLELVKGNLEHLKIAEIKLQTLLEKKYLRYLERNAYYLPIGEFIPLDI